MLVVDPERLHLCLAIKGKEDCYFMYDDKTYYHLDLKHPERLQFTKGREVAPADLKVLRKRHCMFKLV